jgi:[acyl-carrier-protein] S-malonyltransferase
MQLAFVFPGRGSQSVGMLAALASRYPQTQAVFDRASRVLGYDLWSLAQQGPEEPLNRTQPVMLAAGVAVWRLWQDRQGPAPALMAGHSLGEYTALVCAGALAFDDAVALVAERGRLMQEAVAEGQGAMATVLGLDAPAVEEICRLAAQQGPEGEVVEVANHNALGQIVIAGHAGAVARAMDLARAAGSRRCVPLPVSIPSHCWLMRPAAQRLAERLDRVEIKAPRVPVLHNVDAQPRTEPQAIREALTEQLYSPVRWTQTMQRMAQSGVRAIVECGPGKVLAGLVKRAAPGASAYAVLDPDSLDQALAALEGGLS